jgi:hypothetical protein
MPQKTNLKASPYYDDYDRNKNFYRVLFRPSYPIQARELNTLQSILQNQIESYGNFSFKQGDLVIPGEVGLNTRLDYIKLSSVSEVAVNVDGAIVYKKYDIKQLKGQNVIGLSSGVVASVLEAEYATNESNDTLYVKYLTGGDSAEEKRFRQGETLEVVDGINSPLLVVGTDGSVLPTTIQVTNVDTGLTSQLDSPAMGFASAVKVEEGIYFVNGFFIRNEEQLLVIDKYYDQPSAKIGFNISESLVTPEEDPSLYDNALNSSNFSAPGAHRLNISLVLTKYEYDGITDKNFIQLLSVKNGVIQKQIKQAEYNLIESTLARRTYDESGDYVVDNFSVDIREYYQKDNNLGVYQLSADGLVNGFSPEEANKKLIANVSPGKAYVKGYEIVQKESKQIILDKARETLSRDNITLKTKGLSQYKITNVYNSVPLNAEGSDLSAYPTLYLNSVFNDASIGLNNTESSTDTKQSTLRRGKGFTKNDGIKTIYIQVTNTTKSLGAVDDTSLLPGTASNKVDLKNLWFIKTRTQTGSVSTVDTISGISFAKVEKPEIFGPGALVLELTVVGRKDLLQEFLLEYDDNSVSKQRKIYFTQNDAQNELNEFGYIIDYNEVITPIIGVAKPKDFSFIERGFGFNPDIDNVVSKGRLPKGTSVYNAVFGLSYFNPIFFTKLLLDSNVTSAFSSGKYIFGTTSGAYGVIEGETNGFLSSGNNLFIKTLYGNFVSGETIVAEDGSTLRIAKENTVSHFIVVKRGVGYSASSFVNLDGVPYETSKIKLEYGGGGTLYKVSVIDRDAVSIAYASPPSISITSPSNPSTAAVIVPVLFKNTVLNYSPQNVKSFYSSFGSANNNFTADIEITKSQYSEISQVTEFSFTGTKGSRYLECVGFNGDASIQLIQGDIIQYNDNTGAVNKVVVQYATKPEGAIKSRIYIDNVLPNNVSSSSVIRLRPIVDNTTKSSLIFPTGSKEVDSLIKSTEDSKIKYYFRRDFVTVGSSNGGNITFAAQLPFGTQRFVSFNEKDFIITVLDPGNSTAISKGDILYVSPDFIQINNISQQNSDISSGTITINFPENYFGNNITNFPKLKLTATVEVSKAKPKIKTTVANKRIVVVASGDRVIPLRGRDYDSEDVNINSYSDAYKLIKVYEGSSSLPPVVDTNNNLISGTDVTDRFTFDDGQRDTFYDVSRIVLKPGFQPTTGQLVIAFDYFEHSQGDFCTVDSYVHESGVLPDEIPSFNSSVYGIVSLKNVIDFRPKVDSATTITGFQDKSILSQPDYISFTGSGGTVSSTPAPSDNIEFTISFSESQYLDRIDALFLNKNGEFVIKKGNPSLNPSKPDIIDDGISLYYFYVPAFTKSSKDVRILPVDNKRYTMKDIGKLEKRIERLEYYTTLSILEQQALNMQIKDDIGLDRLKSGFIVDNFETHRVGNLKSIDYKCSIDTQQSVLRTQTKEDSFSLLEVNTRKDQRDKDGYRNSNGVISLPFTDVVYAKNEFASKTINPNPFVILQYVGDGYLQPSIDQWYDNSVAPLITDNNTGLFSIFLAKDDIRESFASIYNSFLINWVGTNKSFYNINSLANSNIDASISSVEIASIASSSNISPQNNEIAKGVAYKTVNNNSVIDTIQFFARSIPVKFVIKRLKPKTQVYVFCDSRNIGRWVCPDSRFTEVAGNSLTAFNSPIVTDEYGNASGIILIPAGKAPRENTTWTGDAKTVVYDEFSEELRFTTGIKTLRFTTSVSDENKDKVDSYAEVKYYATGIMPENPASIISTTPAYFKANEGVQLVDNNTSNKEKPNALSQTFKIENFDGGLFVTGVDLFFAKKSLTIPVRVYLSNVESGVPGKYIIPGTEITLHPNTFLKVFASGNLTVKVGEIVTGARSTASGPVFKVYDKNNIEVLPSASNEISLSNEQVYTLVLNNHNGKSFIESEDLSIQSVTQFNNANNTNLLLKIAKDSGKVTDLILKSTGSGYESAVITIESPQLPGGSTATGLVRVSDGKIYLAELGISGRGYTEPPSVVIRGTGSSATGAVIESKISIDEPAVRMGVSIDAAGSIQSTTASKFKFEYPVYLQNDTEYSLSIETDSTDYELWASKLGEIDKSTGAVINTQPLLGSVYKSQNTDNWTEDLFEDIKFTLYRAEFASRPATLLLTNEDLQFEKMELNPFETYAFANTNATSPLFKNNNSIVKVRHRDNGFEPGGKSYVYFKSVEEVGGLSSIALNSQLYKVSNCGVDYYNIVGPSRAGSTEIGGGKTGLVSYNRKYEKLYTQINYLQASGTNIDSYVTTTNIIPVDSKTQNYTSYSLAPEEKIFLNTEQYFLNQKVLASRVNQTFNNIERSLTYRFVLSTTKSYLSPIIDLRNASIKTINNRVENCNGFEDRFGKRYQKLKFYSVYRFTVSGNNATAISLNQTVKGLTSSASGEILRVIGNDIFVKVKNNLTFVANELLFFSSQSASGGNLASVNVSISSAGIFEQTFTFVNGASIVAFNPLNVTEKYDNKITGKIIQWDPQVKELIIENDKNPINSDYVSKITLGSAFSRKNVTNQQSPDIFRVGDLISYDGVTIENAKFVEVSSMEFTPGIDFVAENGSKNSSAVAKYVTKEVSINNPATAIDMRMTLNVKDIKNVKVLYKKKDASSQQNFDDLNWEYFNIDGSPDNPEIATADNTISGQFEKQSSYQELRYSASNLPEFSSYAIKIVMQSDDPAFVPKIQDIRVVASY